MRLISQASLKGRFFLVVMTTHQPTEEQWEHALVQRDGDLLQSWRWGTFKRLHGWDVERVLAGGTLAQILFRRRGPLTIAYIPRGPVFSDDPADVQALQEAIDDVCIRRRVVTLIIDPDRPLPPSWTSEEGKFRTGAEAIQTPRTVKVPLLDDDELLAQMRKDTRYNIQYARRHDVVVERADAGDGSLRTFYGLLFETSNRKAFGIHDFGYYQSFMDTFGDHAVLMFTRVDGEVTAGLISARFGVEGRTMYAGSSHARRNRGDAALLRFDAMRWAREHGCTRFDLGGIAPEAVQRGAEGSTDEDRRVETLRGVNQFKIGFGGKIVPYPPSVERRYSGLLSWVVRTLHPRFRSIGKSEEGVP